MTTLIYWFRNDLRLTDNPAFLEACNRADRLLPIYIHLTQAQATHALGFPREGSHRKAFLRESLDDLRMQLRALGSDLLEYSGEPADVLVQLAQVTRADAVYCERIEAPEEIRQSQQILERGISLQEFWQSSMLSPESLSAGTPVNFSTCSKISSLVITASLFSRTRCFAQAASSKSIDLSGFLRSWI